MDRTTMRNSAWVTAPRLQRFAKIADLSAVGAAGLRRSRDSLHGVVVFAASAVARWDYFLAQGYGPERKPALDEPFIG
jgi:hypothetical protein